MKKQKKPPFITCVHEAGHVVAAWLAGVRVYEACASVDGLSHASPIWHDELRVEQRWVERERWERSRVTAAGQAATMLVYPQMVALAEHFEVVASDDRQEFEFSNDDWYVGVAEAEEDLAPWMEAVKAVAGALFEHGKLDLEMLEALRGEVGLA